MSAGLKDWGVQPELIEGTSQNSGLLMWKNGKGQESGMWQCTPGTWRLSMPGDELCHFVSGRATYTSDNGEIIEVEPGVVVHFKRGWSGVCIVHETMRNIYMLVE